MAERRVLLSWKEISTYSHRGVRTLHRYEEEQGFPIHRPAGKSRSSVLAFSDEIDAWFSKAEKRTVSVANGDPPRLREARMRTCHAIASKATHSKQIATATWEACLQQAQRVQAMMKRLEKYRKPRAV